MCPVEPKLMLLGATGTEAQNKGGGASRTADAEGTGLHAAKRRKAGRRPQRQPGSILDAPGEAFPSRINGHQASRRRSALYAP